MSELDNVVHDLSPMPVHVVNGSDIAYSHLHEKQCTYRHTFHSYMLLPATGGATPQEGVNYIKIGAWSPNKKRTTIVVTAQLGNAQFGQGIICHSVSAATSAASLTGATAPGNDLPGFALWGSRNANYPLILETQSDLWAACPTDAAAGGILVSIAEEFEEAA